MSSENPFGKDSILSIRGYFTGQLLLSFGILLGIVVVVCVGAIIAVYGGGVDFDDAAAHSALVMVIVAVLISFNDIRLHYQNNHWPEVQKHVRRILLMVPIYSFQSWLSLKYYEYSLLFDTLRDLYEAFVIASFVYFCIELLGGWDNVCKIFMTKDQEKSYHPAWLCFGKKRQWAELGEPLLGAIEISALQYVVVKVVAAIIIIATEAADVYDEGSLSLQSAYIYVSIMVNFSQMYALYGLGFLYVLVHPELTAPKNWQPLGKFACVKAVIFFTWWQGFFIMLLHSFGAFENVSDTWTSVSVEHGIQDYLICIEMLFFAITHHFVFTYEEYIGTNKNNDEVESNISSTNIV